MSRHSILLVENDHLVARAALRILTRHALPVVWAADCESALRLATTAQPSQLNGGNVAEPAFQVGIFDIDLTDGNGVSLAEQLLASGAVQHCVFYTATSHQHLLQRAHELGTVFSKPDGLSRLVVELGQLLEETPPLARSGFPPTRTLNRLEKAG